MAKSRNRGRDLTKREKGAAFIAWYKGALAEFPEGLITRAQAAHILGVSNMAIERLIGRGHIRAVYFPREPGVEQIAVGDDDPFWKRLLGHVGPLVNDPESVQWVQAVYVAMEDVVTLWERGQQKEESRIDWKTIWQDVATDLAAGRAPSSTGPDPAPADGSG
jgi:hypothetical protein